MIERRFICNLCRQDAEELAGHDKCPECNGTGRSQPTTDDPEQYLDDVAEAGRQYGQAQP